MCTDLPEELLFDILLRVEIKSLISFTAVSKSWYSLITSSDFVKAHLATTQTQKQPSLLLLRRFNKDEKKEYFSVHPDNSVAGAGNGEDPFILNSVELDFPLESSLGYIRVVGTCDGLVCLWDDLFSTAKPIIVWNPSIHTLVTLPSPSINPQCPYMCVLGFGVDSSWDHKVVRIVYSKNTDLEMLWPPEVEIYSLNRSLWKRVNKASFRYQIAEYIWSQAFVSGSVHWIANVSAENDEVGRSMRRSIVGFDMDKEVFNEILLPDTLVEDFRAVMSLTVHKGCLALLRYRHMRNVCSIWVMKEYGVVDSWTRMYRVKLKEGLQGVVGLRNNDLLMCKDGSELVSYDPKSNVIKELGLSSTSRAFSLNNYQRTLVLLKGNSRFLEEERNWIVTLEEEIPLLQGDANQEPGRRS